MRAVPVPTILAVALIVAGCGGQEGAANVSTSHSTSSAQPGLSNAAYNMRLQALRNQLVDVVNLVSQRPPQFSLIVHHVGRAQQTLRASARALASLTVPMNAAADNRKFVTGLRSFASYLTKLKLAARRHNAGQIAAFNRTLGRSPALQSMLRAARNLEAKGYKLGVLATGP
jgi:hypothetical protein